MAEPPGKSPARPLAQAAVEAIRQNNAVNSRPAPMPDNRMPAPKEAADFGQSAFAESGFLESTLEPGKPRKLRDPNAPRYVGGIR